MSIVKNIEEVLHRIKVRLYPNYLPGVEGKYIARTNNEAMLTIEDVCAALKNRGGFGGSYELLVEHTNLVLDEAAYQLCDGFAVNFGYFSIHPNVGGTFNSPKEAWDPQKNSISFRYRTRAAMRRLIAHIKVEIEGIADSQGFFGDFRDVEAKSTNGVFVPGDQFVISGNKIKVAGEDPCCGVFFVPVDDPSRAVKVDWLAKNTQSEIIGRSPKTGFLNNKIEIRTQCTGAAKVFLKSPRTITSPFIVEEA